MSNFTLRFDDSNCQCSVGFLFLRGCPLFGLIKQRLSSSILLYYSSMFCSACSRWYHFKCFNLPFNEVEQHIKN